AHSEYAAAPVLAELARWEWTMTDVFDAADATALTHAELARVSPEQWAGLRFTWHPSLRRLALSWNAPQIWQALTADAERPQASQVCGAFQLSARRRRLGCQVKRSPAHCSGDTRASSACVRAVASAASNTSVMVHSQRASSASTGAAAYSGCAARSSGNSSP